MYLRVGSLRRFLVYIIDLGLISIVSSLILIGVLKLINFDTARYDLLWENIYNGYIDYALGRNNYLFSEAGINDVYEYAQLYMIRWGINIGISFVLSILYLVILPYFTKWQTLGRLVTRTIVISNNGEVKLPLYKVIIRELIGTFLVYIVFGGIIGLISAIIAIVTERSLVDRISGSVLVFDTPVVIRNNENFQSYQQSDYSNMENDYEKQYNKNNDNDYIDAEVQEKDEKSDDSDDEYRVI